MNRRDLMAGGAAMIGSAMTLRSAQAAQGQGGFYVPPEEAPHQRTFMQWPVSTKVHPDPVFLKMTQSTIANIANAISEFEPVVMLAAPADHAKARRMLSANVELWDIPTEDLWCRDSGPLFAINDAGEIVINHIQFNGWGAKQVHKRDGTIAQKIAERLGLKLNPTGLHGEAGGVEHDGHGRLIAHESSWVNDNRNPGMTRDEIEHRLLNAYGADKMIWSPGVWGEDITDYHIDSLARFTGPGRVLINLPQNPDMSDSFHKAAYETYETLRAAGLQVRAIPEPEKRRVKSLDFVASYANYYVCNGAVIAAQFSDPETDALASGALASAYEGREVVTLNVDALGELGGGIHCATQQMPAV